MNYCVCRNGWIVLSNLVFSLFWHCEKVTCILHNCSLFFLEIVQIYQRWPQPDSLVAGPRKAVGGQTCRGFWGSRSRIYITADWAAYVFLLMEVFGPGYCHNYKNSSIDETKLQTDFLTSWAQRLTKSHGDMLKKTQFDKRLPSKCVQFPFGKKTKLILLLSFSVAPLLR